MAAAPDSTRFMVFGGQSASLRAIALTEGFDVAKSSLGTPAANAHREITLHGRCAGWGHLRAWRSAMVEISLLQARDGRRMTEVLVNQMRWTMWWSSDDHRKVRKTRTTET